MQRAPVAALLHDLSKVCDSTVIWPLAIHTFQLPYISCMACACPSAARLDKPPHAAIGSHSAAVVTAWLRRSLVSRTCATAADQQLQHLTYSAYSPLTCVPCRYATADSREADSMRPVQALTR
jgi:hypothetical protein